MYYFENPKPINNTKFYFGQKHNFVKKKFKIEFKNVACFSYENCWMTNKIYS